MHDVYWKDRVARIEVIAGTVLLSAVIISLANAAMDEQKQSPNPTIIPTPNCQIDTRTLPSSEASITVFDTKTCPPTSH